MNFRGKPVTKERFGWWLRIALTRIFGRKVRVEGRETPLKVLPWIYKGELKLMGLERASVSLSFKDQYTAELREAPYVEGLTKDPAASPDFPVWNVVLGHQRKLVIEEAFSRFRTLGSDYGHLLAYGGDRAEFDRLSIPNKVYLEDSSLRGPSHLMSHYELIEKSWQLIRGKTDGSCFVVFSESDLLPLQEKYLDGCIDQMKAYHADFGAREIRNLSRTNNPFLIHAIDKKIIPPDQDGFLHALGCFFILRSTMIPAMLDKCRAWEGLYFEIMFPSAVAAADGRLLSLSSVCDDLKHVAYRPELSVSEAQALGRKGYPMVHPVKP